MDYHLTLDISASGMAAQKVRLEAAAANLANMHVAYSASGPNYQPLTAVLRSVPMDFARVFESGSLQPRAVRAELQPQPGEPTRTVFEPTHPEADASGRVRYPAVNHLQEMMTVMTALRAYEANLGVFQSARSMALRALEIGGQS